MLVRDGESAALGLTEAVRSPRRCSVCGSPVQLTRLGPLHPSTDAVVPCDVLLLNGAIVSNEAILTGEATPQQKTSIADCSPEEELSLRRQADSGHRQHVVFGGTRVIVASPAWDALPRTIPRPPDGGCVGYVIRNGFNTTQGKLVRTIIFCQEQASANTRLVHPGRQLPLVWPLGWSIREDVRCCVWLDFSCIPGQFWAFLPPL